MIVVRTSKRLYLITVILMTGALLLQGEGTSAVPTVTVPAIRLSEVQAVQLARTFCQNIGQPVTAAGTATFAADAQAPPSHYWQPIWDVTFPGQAEVEVVDATGIIASYNNKARRQEDHQLRQDASVPDNTIPQQEAIQRAKDVLAATRQTEPLEFNWAQLASFNPMVTNSHTWFVWWYRTSHGIRYYDQHVGIYMDAQTGEIGGLILNLTSPPLTSAVQAVREIDAINIGAAEVVRQGIEQGATHKETHLEIITPNNRWPHSTDKPGQDTSVRLAWAVTFIVDGHWRQVKIDTETGEILDEGRDNGPGGKQAAGSVKVSAPPPIMPMLRSVRAVYVRGRDANGKWATKPLLKFGTKDQPHAVALLRKTSDFRKEGPAGAASQQIVLVSRSSAIGVYSYFPDTGLLGGNSDWAAVPDEFKTWVQRKTASASASTAKGAHR